MRIEALSAFSLSSQRDPLADRLHMSSYDDVLHHLLGLMRDELAALAAAEAERDDPAEVSAPRLLVGLLDDALADPRSIELPRSRKAPNKVLLLSVVTGRPPSALRSLVAANQIAGRAIAVTVIAEALAGSRWRSNNEGKDSVLGRGHRDCRHRKPAGPGAVHDRQLPSHHAPAPAQSLVVPKPKPVQAAKPVGSGPSQLHCHYQGQTRFRKTAACQRAAQANIDAAVNAMKAEQQKL